ncbi:alpha-amylase family glycosyl hydrolase [Halobacillus salinarum]|uniref:Alpha-amylase family glycosyl hydrolase n=1 Tax=Halobacillus salinarum TaxID=2932257 RepID=A0ABY4EN20_9BACI|nr:alpha-amylase family glycosyl hydrolase [Halobacillus salinarum]UOQ45059.1 alpha-amylase family glycosyl hydrolase [Halobacillus salinarum]
MNEPLMEKIRRHLTDIYGRVEEKDVELFSQLVDKWSEKDWQHPAVLTEKNVYLIAYGDSIYEQNTPTLPTLHKFLSEEVGNAITDVHLLPMFPFTSDDGFSVSDYRTIHPKLGDWSHIRSFSEDYRLMFDFVANHISQESEWFQRYLANDSKYKHFFIPKEDHFDASRVVRPRTSPLFHEYEEDGGQKQLGRPSVKTKSI